MWSLISFLVNDTALFGSQNLKIQKQAQQRIPHFLREYMKSATHSGLFLYLSLK